MVGKCHLHYVKCCHQQLQLWICEHCHMGMGVLLLDLIHWQPNSAATCQPPVGIQQCKLYYKHIKHYLPTFSSPQCVAPINYSSLHLFPGDLRSKASTGILCSAHAPQSSSTPSCQWTWLVHWSQVPHHLRTEK